MEENEWTDKYLPKESSQRIGLKGASYQIFTGRTQPDISHHKPNTWKEDLETEIPLEDWSQQIWSSNYTLLSLTDFVG